MKSKIGQTGTSLRAGFRSLDAIAEKYCLFHFVVQGPWSFSGWSTFLYDVRLRSYGASKLPNVPSGDQPTAHGLHPRMIPISPRGSRRSKGVHSGTGDFLRLLVGELGTPKLSQIFAYGKWLYLLCGAGCAQHTTNYKLKQFIYICQSVPSFPIGCGDVLLVA